MKKFSYIVLVLLSLVGLAAWVVPRFINWDQYKPLISKEFHASTGRTLVFEGPIEVSILPTPHVKLKKMTLANISGGQAPYLAHVEEVNIFLKLTSLVFGHVAIDRVRIKKPDIHFETLSNGKKNWELTIPSPDKKSQKGGDASTHNQKMIPENVIIQQGRIQYTAGKDTSMTLERINGLFAINPSENTYTSKGRLYYENTPVTFELNASEGEDASKMNVKGCLSHQRNSGSVKGVLDVPSFRFHGEVDGNIESFYRLKMIPVKAPLAFQGRVSADQTQFEIQDFQIHQQKSKIANLSVQAKFSNVLTYKGDISLVPGQSNLSFSGKKEDTEIAGKIHFQSGSLQELSKWLNMNPSYLPLKQLQNVSLDTDYVYRPQDSRVDLAPFLLKAGKTAAEGTFTYRDGTYIYEFKVRQPHDILDAYDVQVPYPLKFIGLSGETAYEKESLTTNSKIKSDLMDLSVEGRVFDLDKNLKYDVELSAHYKKLEAVLGGQKASLKASSHLSGDLKKVNIESLSGALQTGPKKSHFKAAGSYALSHIKPRLEMNIELDDLNLDDLLKAHSDTSDSKSGGDATSSSHESADSKKPSMGKTLQNFECDMKVTSNLLSWKSLQFENVALSAQLKDGIFELGSFYAGFLGGELTGSGSVKLTLPMSLTFFSRLVEANLQYADLSGPYKVSSPVHGDVRIESQGQSWEDLLTDLDGGIDFTFGQGEITGANIQALLGSLANISNLSSAQGVMDVFEGGTSKAKEKFNGGALKAKIDKGIIKVEKGDVSADMGKGHLEGTASLPDRKLNLFGEVKLKINNQSLSVPYTVTGPFSKPKYDYDTSALVQGKLGNFLKKGIASKVLTPVPGVPLPVDPLDLLGGIFGGGKKKAPAKD